MAQDPDRRMRFEREARAVAALRHPHIVTIHSVEEDRGTLFLTMELVEGHTLSEIIPNAGVSLDRFFAVAVPLVEAVAAAHQKGITHRDLKPANVMIGSDKQLKVLDFGLAKHFEIGPAEKETLARGATAEGRILGTVAYMSPEQAEGKPVDPRSDIFSLGVLLYEMATGARPFKGDTNISTITSILRDEPPSVDPAQAEPAPAPRAHRQAVPGQGPRPPLSDRARSPERPPGIEGRAGLGGDGCTRLRSAPTPSTAGSSRRWVLLGSAAVLAIVAMVAVVKLLPGSSAPPPPVAPAHVMRMTRLTDTGKSIEAAISPDGKVAAHVKLDKGVSSLWITQVSTASSVEIVPPSDRSIWDPIFDRAGEFVYYIGQDRGAEIPVLYRIPVLGGTPRRVLEGVSQTIAFAPDGARFAFLRTDPGSLTKSMIVVVNTDGSGERVLATKDFPEQFSENPSWSPDGKLIAAPVQSFRKGIESYVVTFPAEGGEEKRLSARTWLQVSEIAWLPEGSGLVLAATESFVGGQLWELSYPGGTDRRITNDVNTYGGVSLTADGRILAVGLDESSITLQTVDAGGRGEAKPLTRGKNREDGQGISWTPDGRIVYGSADESGLGLWITGEGGGGPQKITQVPSVGPEVSPDGRFVVYLAAQDGIHIWRANLDGTNPVQLTRGPVESDPHWSRDGRWVVFRSGLENQIYKVSAEGGEPVLVHPAKGVSAFAVSPDGTRIALRAWDAAARKSRTLVIPFAGGEPVADAEHSFGNPAMGSRRPRHRLFRREGRRVESLEQAPGRRPRAPADPVPGRRDPRLRLVPRRKAGSL